MRISDWSSDVCSSDLDFGRDFTVEVVAGNVQLSRPHFGLGAIEAAGGVFGHARGMGDVALVFGELLEHRQLFGFLKPAKPYSHGSRFGGDDDDGGVRPVGGRNRRDAVADADRTRTRLNYSHYCATR